VGGTVYFGEFKLENWALGSGKGTAEEHVAEHPIGSTLVVRYNLEKPQETFTEFDRVITPRLAGSVAVCIFVTIFLWQSYGK